MYFMRDIIIPLIIAVVLVVLVQALIHAIDRWVPMMPQWLVTFSAAIVIFYIAGAVIYVLVEGTTQFVHQSPELYTRVDALIARLSRTFELEKPLNLTVLAGDVRMPQLAARVLAAVQGLFSSLMLVLLYFVFLLAERKKVAKKVRLIADTSKQSALILRGLEQISEDIETYVWVQTITGLMLATGSAAIMLAVGLENALFWTFVLFLLSFIPILGVTAGSIAPALFALLQFSTVWQAIIIFAGIQVVAFVVGNLFYPQMQARTQNISPVATLLSLAFWGALWGVPGAFLSVPLTLVLMLICAKFDSTRWVAVLLSNDGEPQTLAAHSRERSSRTPAADF